MKKLSTLLSTLLFTFALFANTGKDLEVTSNIKNVTVFKKGAQVSREAKATIPSGNSIIKFVGISPNINKESIQVKGDGDFTILSVLHQTNYYEAPKDEVEINRLTLAYQALQEKVEIENAMLSVFAEEESLILTNKSIGGQQTGVQISELKATADFYRERLKEIRLEKLRLNKVIKNYQVEQQKISGELGVLNKVDNKYTSEIVLAIQSDATVSASFVLGYVVNNASWFPNYDIRIKDVKNPIELAYKGNIFQTSGEDWNNVKLTLSTGDPAKSGVIPQIAPWKLQYYQAPIAMRGRRRSLQSGVYSGLTQGNIRTVSGVIMDEYGEKLIGANVMVPGTSHGTVTDINGRYTLNIPANTYNILVSYIGYQQIEATVNSSNMNIVLSEGVQLDNVVVTSLNAVKGYKKDKAKVAAPTIPIQTTPVDNTTTIEFQIKQPYTIPTDGKQYTVAMDKHTLPAYYEYYCVPKLDKDAFLTAQVTGWEDLNLLSGEANLFFEGTYLGKSFLNAESVNDTLDISLGRDKNIVVTRTKSNEKLKPQFIGNKQTDNRAFEIEIRNKKKQTINIVIEDQFPISTHDDIEVKQESYKEATLDKKTGILKWTFELDSNETKKLEFRYSVKYPKKYQVTLE